jgi:hemoglobin
MIWLSLILTNDIIIIIMDSKGKCVYARLGGDGAVSDLIDQFYYKVLFDKSLRGFFYKADMSRVRLQQKIYFACRMFGQEDQKYEGR